MMVVIGNIFLHQLNILLLALVFRQILVWMLQAHIKQVRSEDLSSWEYVPDHRGETVYSIDTGNPEEITVLGDYPENTTTIAPLTPYDKWDGEKWVVDTEAQHSAAVEAAETKRQSLIDTAMASISLIQLKLQAGRKLTQAETTQLNSVLDYIDELNAMDLTTAPDLNWPEKQLSAAS